MIAPARYTIVIHGEAARCRPRYGGDPQDGLKHLLLRLVSGETVSADALAGYGLTVWIEPDRDQGEDAA